MRSQTLNISRYTNGTLARIQTAATSFVSHDYDPATGTGTFTPPSTRLAPSFSGGLSLGAWQYLDGGQWKPVVDGEHGFVFSGTHLVVYATSDLFGNADGTLTIRLLASNPDYWDSVTLTREVSPLELYRKSNTQINQTNDKIALIASSEELAKYSTVSTMSSNLSSLEQTSQQFRQTVEGTYATKAVAKGYADTAQSNAAADATAKANAAQAAAQEYTTTQLTRYSTITQTDDKITTAVATKTDAAQVESIIEQKADSIRLKADAISWESTNSSMTEDGTLTCHNANLDGLLTVTGDTSESTVGKSNVITFYYTGGFSTRTLENFHYNIKDSEGKITDSKSLTKFANVFQETAATIKKKLYRILSIANNNDDLSENIDMSNMSNAIEEFSIDSNEDPAYMISVYKGTQNTREIAVGSKGISLGRPAYGNIDSTFSELTGDSQIAVGLDRLKIFAGDTSIMMREGSKIKAGRGNISQKSGNENNVLNVYDNSTTSKAATTGRIKIDTVGASIDLSGTSSSDYKLKNSSGTLYFDGNKIQYASSSSRRYKHDIKLVEDSEMDPHRLYDLRAVQFVFNDDIPLQYTDMKGKPLVGFIAEDVETVYPNAVIHNDDGEVENWDERRIIPPMLSLIQEQKREIEGLRAEIKELKTTMEELRHEIHGQRIN
jgi:hypothetical protein